jgi:hypothetical protein
VAHACQSSVIGCQSSVISRQSSVIGCLSSVIGCQSSVSQERTSMKRAQVNRGRRLTAVHSSSANKNQQDWLEFHLLTFPSSCRCNSSQFPSHFPLQCASSANKNQQTWLECIFSPFCQVVGATPASFQATSHYACAQSQPSHTHAHTTQTHIDSTSTNMKFSFVSFLAAVFSSPPSTPLFGEGSSVMVRILCFSL